MVARAPRWLVAHGGPVALYLGLALLLCASVLPDPGATALGHPGNDVWNHLWGYWWVARSLAGGELPLHTGLLAWPAGGALWFIDAFDAALLAPVTLLAGPAAAYNLGLVLNLALCGVGARLLALHVTGSAPGALLAGVAWMTTPHLLAQVYNGISETVAAGWLPLAALAILHAAEAPSPRRGALAGLATGVTAVANWYYGLFAGIGLVALLAGALLRAVRRTPSRRQLVRVAAALAAGGAVAALVAGPPLALFVHTMGAADALVTRDEDFVWRSLVMHNMTDLVSLVRPGRHYSPDLNALFGEHLLVVVYLGATLLLPAAWVAVGPLRRRAAPWLALAVLFGVLAAGPFLYVGGRYVEVGGAPVPLPFLWLFEGIPAFGRISHAYRFSLATSLALSVVVAFAVAGAPRLGLRPGLLALGLGLGRVGESLVGSPAVWPLPVVPVESPAAYARLGGGAVLDLPVTVPVLERSRLLVHQFVHHQPLPYGLNDPVPHYLHVNHYTRTLVELERRDIAYLPAELPLFDLAAAKADLVARGARWVVLRADAYGPATYARVARFLDLTATVAWDEDGLRVYDLAPR